ncbi:tetratricopeptide repeat protein [Mucisphaera calidilacus]|uniref:Photosystem I assembly protein Ycf3 n=1 Tax=Mucisphaera calidilacus TaxID=2527982 RepID=A0A518BZQ5_9BACT|nr:tetratricopeptide repeat protein [Mucisphaera calidilacus]QDU72457.1 photosystem I assembly protein Ycf3 [Mucisphaera calidilacus]
MHDTRRQRRFWGHPLAGAGLLMVAMLVFAGCQSSGTEAQSTTRAADPQARQLVRQAQVSTDAGNTAEALAMLAEAIERDPDLTEAHVAVGQIQLDAGNVAAARTSYVRAVQTDPRDYDAQYGLALVNQILGRVSEAVQGYQRALSIDPESFDARRDLASAFLQAGRPDLSLRHAVTATEMEPESRAAWINLGAAYTMLGQHERAVRSYQQAAELGELDPPLLQSWAQAHLNLREYDRAANLLQQLVQDQPSAFAHERYGYALFKQRKRQEAVVQFQAALQLDREMPQALNGIGVCLMAEYLETGRRNPALRDRAIAAWRRSLTVEPRQPKIVDLMTRFGRIAS